MIAGFETRNSSGTIQVDSTQRNYLLIKSGQFSWNARDMANTAKRWAAENPIGQTGASILMVRSTNPGGVRPSTGSYIGARKYCNFGYTLLDSGSFQYYIFDLVAPSLADRFGLQTFDEKGNLTYNALDYPLRILYTGRSGNAHPTTNLLYTAPHPNIAYGCFSGGKDVNHDDIDVECYYTYLRMAGSSVYTNVIYDEYGSSDGMGVGNWGDAEMTVGIVDTTNIPLNWSRQ